MMPGRSVIYDSATVRVIDATFPDDRGAVAVTFPARTDRQGLHRPGFGEKFLASRGISAIHLTASWNHWFQVGETEAALEAVRAAAARFGRVVTYGSSMGGFAALACSKSLAAQAVIAISPQFSIDAAKVPWERRWRADADRIIEAGGFRRDDMGRLLSRDADIHVAFDPRGTDGAHAARILQGTGRPHPLVLPFAGHPAGGALLQSGQLKRWVLGIVGGDDVSDVRRLFRRARRNLPGWWSELALSLGTTRGSVALHAARTALQLAPQDPGIAYSAARSLMRAGAVSEASEAIAEACRHRPRTAKYQMLRASLLGQQSRYDAALQAYQAAAQLTKGDYKALVGIAEAYIGLGRVTEALDTLDRAALLKAPPPVLARLQKLLASSPSGT